MSTDFVQFNRISVNQLASVAAIAMSATMKLAKFSMLAYWVVFSSLAIAQVGLDVSEPNSKDSESRNVIADIHSGVEIGGGRTEDLAKNPKSEASSLQHSIVGKKWKMGNGHVIFKEDGVFVTDVAPTRLVRWGVIDQDSVVLKWDSGDYDIIKFSKDRKSFEKQWLGRPTGRAMETAIQVDR
jgi:hypothetical protein